MMKLAARAQEDWTTKVRKSAERAKIDRTSHNGSFWRNRRTGVGAEGVVNRDGDGSARPEGQQALHGLGAVRGVDADSRLPLLPSVCWLQIRNLTKALAIADIMSQQGLGLDA